MAYEDKTASRRPPARTGPIATEVGIRAWIGESGYWTAALADAPTQLLFGKTRDEAVLAAQLFAVRRFHEELADGRHGAALELTLVLRVVSIEGIDTASKTQEQEDAH